MRMLRLFLFGLISLSCPSWLCAQQPPDAPKPAAPKPEPAKEKPFDEIIKDLTVHEGLFTLYRGDEKLYLEIKPEQFDRIFMFNITCESGIGDRGIDAASMCGETPFVLHKLGKNVQWIAKNPAYTAQPGTPIRRSVDRSFSDSLIGAVPILSLPHPERKSVVVDLGALLLTDLPYFAHRLERSFRLTYRFDAKNSSFGLTKAFPLNLELETIAHYASDRLPVPPLLAPGAPQPPQVSPPRTLPDPRSMFLRFRYSISALPEDGYQFRLADDRVGYFTTDVSDYTGDTHYTPKRRMINRWRLEKKDPAAAISEPKKPIVYWLENSIPEKYREPLRQGILEWNKAFEMAGFRNAVEVRQQPDDADWDPADVRYSTIRWMTFPNSAYAVGPSSANPYTGEIYDADIRFSSELIRVVRQGVSLLKGPIAAEEENYLPPWSLRNTVRCDLANQAAEEAAFGMEVLQARGMEPDGPEADLYVSELLKELAMHEVGHTLGLRHNFKASSIRTLADAHKREITSKEGLVGSVMDYIPPNIAATGQTQGEYQMTTVGSWDKWVIEWGYRPGLDAKALNQIASRASEPALAYNTDEDAGVSANPFDMDPHTARHDFGPNTIEYARDRAKLVREVWSNLETKLEKSGEGYQVLRRSFGRSMGQLGSASLQSSRYIGGVSHNRDHVGDPGGRLPYVPVPAAEQKAALAFLKDTLFAANTFQFSPKLLNKLAAERFSDFTLPPGQMDAPMHAPIIQMQRNVLDRVLHPIVLQRVIDSELRTEGPSRFRLHDLFSGLQDSIWSEAKATSPETASHRRNLQREHLRRMIVLVAQGGGAPEDARTMARYTLKSLQSQLAAAQTRAASVETKAHFEESAARIDAALKAGITRTGF